MHIFRHLAQKFLDIRKYACEISIQSDEKSVGASSAQSLCGVALKETSNIINSKSKNKYIELSDLFKTKVTNSDYIKKLSNAFEEIKDIKKIVEITYTSIEDVVNYQIYADAYYNSCDELKQIYSLMLEYIESHYPVKEYAAYIEKNEHTYSFSSNEMEYIELYYALKQFTEKMSNRLSDEDLRRQMQDALISNILKSNFKDDLKAAPHKDCAEDAPTDFSSDCIEILQAY